MTLPRSTTPRSRTAPRRVLVYGDVNLNLIDGSAIWAVAVVEVFARAGCDVTLLLKSRVTTTRLIAPLEAMPNVRIVRPFEERLAGEGSRGQLSPARAARIMIDLDATESFDLVVVRGWRPLERLVDDGWFDGRIWSYLTDVPQAVTEMTAETTERLGQIATASRLVLCQTEDLRGFIESTVPQAAGKCVLYPPVVPALGELGTRKPGPGRPLRLVYSGKLAPLWKTEEMTRLPAQLAERGIAVELHMVGDKIQADPTDPFYPRRMEKALRGSPGVTWHRGLPRLEAIKTVASCDVGLSWRDRELDASLELSTKVLEYGAVGLPVVLNRTPAHEALLGVDYPLFADSEDDLVDAIEASTDEEIFRLAAERCRAAAEGFTEERAVERVRHLLDGLYPDAPALAGRTRPLRIVVASHDLKFFSRLLEQFQSMPELEIRVDAWPALDRHDPEQSRELNDWADVVICEWCGPNAVWYARHKRPDQRLFVRLHRFELYRPWPEQLAIDNVDRIICVSPSYAQLTLQRTGWPDDKVSVIPNWVDVEQLDRTKLPGARFHLGMIGVGESRKRLDIALDVLETVRRHDDRFILFAKTKMPWEYPWIWRRPGEVEATQAVLHRIQNAPRLQGAVVFDKFGPDVGTWLRRIGFILSTSDDESFHLSPAEGMASGAVPVIRNWPGADTIFDPMWIHGEATEMADTILQTVDEERWTAAGEVARAQIRSSYSLERVVSAWTELLGQEIRVVIADVMRKVRRRLRRGRRSARPTVPRTDGEATATPTAGPGLWDLLAPYIPTDHARQVNARYYLDEVMSGQDPPRRVLDLGCGAGNSVDLFRQHDPAIDWVGVDIEDSQEARARRRTDAAFIAYDGVRVPFPDGTFDLVYSSQVLEHVPDPQQHLREIARVLRTGGVLVGSTSQLEPYHSMSYWNITPFGFVSLARGAGMQVRELRPGIDGITLTLRSFLGRPAGFDAWWETESPLNSEIDAWGHETGRRAALVNLRKLHMCGQYAFLATRETADA